MIQAEQKLNDNVTSIQYLFRPEAIVNLNSNWEITGILHPPSLQFFENSYFEQIVVKSKLIIEPSREFVQKTFYKNGVIFFVEKDMIHSLHTEQ